MSNNKTPTAYTLTLSFPDTIDQTKVTVVNYQVTGAPTIQPPLAPNTMPAKFHPNDSLTFTYAAKSGLAIESCLLTAYNVKKPENELQDTNVVFGTAIPINDSFKGSWIFHLLGLYKLNNTSAAYYLDPEFTCS